MSLPCENLLYGLATAWLQIDREVFGDKPRNTSVHLKVTCSIQPRHTGRTLNSLSGFCYISPRCLDSDEYVTCLEERGPDK